MEFNNENISKEEDKFKELFDLSLYALKEEQERFKRIEEKASKYFTILTVLLGVYGFFVKWIIENIKTPRSDIENLFILLSFVLVCLIFYAWNMMLKILKTRGITKIPMNDEMVDFFEKNKRKDIYKSLAKKNGEVLNKNIEMTEEKADLLDKSHKIIIAMGWFLLFYSFLFGIMHIYNKIYK